MLAILISGIIYQVKAQVPVPEDYFDLYEEDDGDDNNGNDETETNPLNLNDIKEALGGIGATGAFPLSALNSIEMVNEGCEKTYVCMYNTLIKVFKIAEYEYLLKDGKLSCSQEKALLQDYALYLLSLNLDLYCVEHLHPDGNTLSDTELVNVMLAMNYFYDAIAGDDSMYGKESLPMLYPYRNIRPIANPYCSEDLSLEGACDCGSYNGTLDLTEKNKLLQNIRTIIDDINPMWQTAKAIEISNRLKELPCKK
ncbi:MAG TPA: hypothetical protein PKW08_10885 [Flavobacteriaceae bacterium]|nr:hypothetical protein [Flavobacteriaceae bacterium]MCB9214204.1 hypothetical protein [Alteromonas sp.]HPF11978.1 hypothetical protein [Flavobacteriaceae bacterium]HQU22081.1 hypothetical protein [Flavobacteriaceae bacterium]HQU66530.1 hypothetical protein [Flavobacteriaceae bacterium]